MADDIPEQVYLVAAQAFGIAANYSVAGTPEMAGHPPFRAAVASAYRAGQAAGVDEVKSLPSFGQMMGRGQMMRAVAKPPPDTSWLQTPEVSEGDRRRNAAAGPADRPLSLGEQPHDSAYCHADGQPHLGPCSAPSRLSALERDVIKKAKAWRRWLLEVDSAYESERPLAAAVDALTDATSADGQT